MYVWAVFCARKKRHFTGRKNETSKQSINKRFKEKENSVLHYRSSDCFDMKLFEQAERFFCPFFALFN